MNWQAAESSRSVEQVLETLRAVIAGSPDFEQVFAHIKSSRRVDFNLGNAREGVVKPAVYKVCLNLRLLSQGREAWGFVDIDDLDQIKDFFRDTLVRLSQAQAQNCKILPFTYLGSTEPGRFIDNTFSIVPIEEKFNRLMNLEAAATKDFDESIELRASYQEGLYREIIWTSLSEKPLLNEWTEAQVAVTAKKSVGSEQLLFSEEIAESTYFDLDWSRLARNAAQAMALNRGNRKTDLGSAKFVANPNVVVEFLSLLSRMMNGNAFASGHSALSTKLGQQVASQVVNIYDDPHYQKKPRSRFWDAEGQPTNRVWHVSAGKFLTPSVPNTGLKGFDLVPTSQMRFIDGLTEYALSIHNLVLEPGTKDYVDLLAELGTGPVVTRIDKISSFDMKTGDLTAVVSGRWLENGQLADAFAEFELKANLLGLFSMTLAVGRDLRWFEGVAAPSILCENKI